MPEELKTTQLKPDEVSKELEPTHALLAQKQQELEVSQNQLKQTEEVLERSHLQLHETMATLEECHTLLQQTQKALEESRTSKNQDRQQLSYTPGEWNRIKAQYANYMVNTVVKLVSETLSEERMDVLPHGAHRQKERMIRVAEYSVQENSGDIVEIGCFQGEITKELAKIARKYNRRVIAVDPWTPNTKIRIARQVYRSQDCFEMFLKNIEPYKDIVDIVRQSSLTADTVDLIREKSLSFAFVDSSSTYEACLQDIQTVSHCAGIICVDDINHTPLYKAFLKGAESTHRRQVYIPICREGYLLWL
ncbi:MAG: class I SAM-dependent methyltransferase [Cyanobacteriota bacterium]|nr:class I SAM-dependent methyltransferase [Cyanobacteriota bacterium]